MLTEPKSSFSSYLCWPLGLLEHKYSISLNFQMQIFFTKRKFQIWLQLAKKFQLVQSAPSAPPPQARVCLELSQPSCPSVCPVNSHQHWALSFSRLPFLRLFICTWGKKNIYYVYAHIHACREPMGKGKETENPLTPHPPMDALNSRTRIITWSIPKIFLKDYMRDITQSLCIVN